MGAKMDLHTQVSKFNTNNPLLFICYFMILFNIHRAHMMQNKEYKDEYKLVPILKEIKRIRKGRYTKV